MKKLLLFLLLIPFFGYSQTKRYKSGDWTYVERIKKEGDAFDGFTTSADKYAYVCNDETCLYIQDFDSLDENYEVQMYISDNSSLKPIEKALSNFYKIDDDWIEYSKRGIIDKTRDFINGTSDSRFDDRGDNWIFKFFIRMVYDNRTTPQNYTSSVGKVEYGLRERYKNDLEDESVTSVIFLSGDVQKSYLFKGDFYTRSDLRDISESSGMSIDEILSIAGEPRRYYKGLQTFSSVSFRFGHSFNDNLTTQTFNLKGSTKAIRFVLGLQ